MMHVYTSDKHYRIDTHPGRIIFNNSKNFLTERKQKNRGWLPKEAKRLRGNIHVSETETDRLIYAVGCTYCRRAQLRTAWFRG